MATDAVGRWAVAFMWSAGSSTSVPPAVVLDTSLRVVSALRASLVVGLVDVHDGLVDGAALRRMNRRCLSELDGGPAVVLDARSEVVAVGPDLWHRPGGSVEDGLPGAGLAAGCRSLVG